MKEKNGYFRKSKKTRGIVLTVFACLICLSAITFGVASLTKKDKKKDTEDVVDLNNVKKNTDDRGTNMNGNTYGDEEDEKTKNNNVDDEKNHQENRNSESLQDNLNNTFDGQEDENRLEDSAKKNENNVTGNEAEAGQESVNGNPDDLFGTVVEGERIEDAENVEDVAAAVSEYSFGRTNSVKWPVQGNVILDYSMDSTIYFPTLNSYKCNPAIVIQSENGTNVIAGVDGVVEEVSTNEEIGNYVVVGVGDGYEITYGQLKDIAVETGDRVSKDTSLGMVGEPTSYYKNEGDNIYFEIKKDGKPCDPLDFLE
ncbi:MAG: M23 family metallopeptidase [Lachnospiraceae bacterium]|nr:M23 family metallopeptidase [Lachnospiraceae bacterium]